MNTYAEIISFFQFLFIVSCVQRMEQDMRRLYSTFNFCLLFRITVFAVGAWRVMCIFQFLFIVSQDEGQRPHDIQGG